ncbi:MAG: helix-turn-helix transcriptional regulator [Acidobacteria bacterium]|nr:helix-turn-helix transcriptional regulator [Acidobacteriota bacterium]
MSKAVLVATRPERSQVRRQSDRAPEPIMRLVTYLRPRDVLVVIFDDGRLYQLPRRVLGGMDKSGVVSVRMDRIGRFFTIKQPSGNKVEVPWDLVLYHCDPNYRYHKYRVKQPVADVGSRIRQARLQAGLTQTELAERTGIKRPNIARIESGKHCPSLDTLEKIAEALNVTVARLVAG